MVAAKQVEQNIVIKPPKFSTVELLIEGIAPLVVERFSKKMELMEKMAQGPSAKNKRERTARDYDNEAEEARYRAPEKWEGMNAAAFRAGMISACRLVGFKMTLAKLCLFVEADGYDVKDGTPLIRITKGQPVYTEMMVRNQTGVADIRARPMWREGWRATLRIRFDADKFSATDIANLVNRLGQQVGIGEGRPDSPQSSGLGWGLFKIINEEKAA